MAIELDDSVSKSFLRIFNSSSGEAAFIQAFEEILNFSAYSVSLVLRIISICLSSHLE